MLQVLLSPEKQPGLASTVVGKLKPFAENDEKTYVIGRTSGCYADRNLQSQQEKEKADMMDIRKSSQKGAQKVDFDKAAHNARFSEKSFASMSTVSGSGGITSAMGKSIGIDSGSGGMAGRTSQQSMGTGVTDSAVNSHQRPSSQRSSAGNKAVQLPKRAPGSIGRDSRVSVATVNRDSVASFAASQTHQTPSTSAGTTPNTSRESSPGPSSLASSKNNSLIPVSRRGSRDTLQGVPFSLPPGPKDRDTPNFLAVNSEAGTSSARDTIVSMSDAFEAVAKGDGNKFCVVPSRPQAAPKNVTRVSATPPAPVDDFQQAQDFIKNYFEALNAINSGKTTKIQNFQHIWTFFGKDANLHFINAEGEKRSFKGRLAIARTFHEAIGERTVNFSFRDSQLTSRKLRKQGSALSDSENSGGNSSNSQTPSSPLKKLKTHYRKIYLGLKEEEKFGLIKDLYSEVSPDELAVLSNSIIKCEKVDENTMKVYVRPDVRRSEAVRKSTMKSGYYVRGVTVGNELETVGRLRTSSAPRSSSAPGKKLPKRNTRAVTAANTNVNANNGRKSGKSRSSSAPGRSSSSSSPRPIQEQQKSISAVKELIEDLIDGPCYAAHEEIINDLLSQKSQTSSSRTSQGRQSQNQQGQRQSQNQRQSQKGSARFGNNNQAVQNAQFFNTGLRKNKTIVSRGSRESENVNDGVSSSNLPRQNLHDIFVLKKLKPASSGSKSSGSKAAGSKAGGKAASGSKAASETTSWATAEGGIQWQIVSQTVAAKGAAGGRGK